MAAHLCHVIGARMTTIEDQQEQKEMIDMFEEQGDQCKSQRYSKELCDQLATQVQKSHFLDSTDSGTVGRTKRKKESLCRCPRPTARY